MEFHMSRYFPFLAALLILPSCAALTEMSCNSRSWYTFGYEDGVNGRSVNELHDLNKNCSSVGLVPNQDEWMQGYKRGQSEYCTPRSAYEVGKRGDSLSGICTAGELSSMREAHRNGYHHYQLTEEMRQLKDEKSALESQLADLDDTASDSQRRRLVSQIDSLDNRIDTLRTIRVVNFIFD